jgi:hypothetical protein
MHGSKDLLRFFDRIAQSPATVNAVEKVVILEQNEKL